MLMEDPPLRFDATRAVKTTRKAVEAITAMAKSDWHEERRAKREAQ